MIIIKIEGKLSIDAAVKKLRNKFIATQVSKELTQRKHFIKKKRQGEECFEKSSVSRNKEKAGSLTFICGGKPFKKSVLDLIPFFLSFGQLVIYLNFYLNAKSKENRAKIKFE